MDVALPGCGCGDVERGLDPQFRLLAEALPQLVWGARSDGACDYVNGRWREYTGLTAEQARDAGPDAVVHPDDAAHVAAAWQAALARGAAFELEVRLRRHDGVHRWFLGRAEPIQDARGRAARWFGTFTDIDDRKRADEGLRDGEERLRRALAGGRVSELTLPDSEELFRNMADHAPVMIWVTGVDASCTYLNRRWYELTGQTEETGLGFGWLAAVHPADKAAAAETFWRAHERREPFRLDYRLRRGDGAYRWCIDSASPRLGPDGEFLGYVGSVIDITERKEAELLLRESEERFRRAVMATPFPIMIHADDGQVVSVNRAWTEISGYTVEQISTIAAWTERAYGPHKGTVRSVIDALYGMQRRSDERELAITTASGEQRTWVFSSAPLGEDTSGRRLVISIAHDVTDRKRAEAALQDADRRKDDFLAMLAHELRNPLGPIRNAVEVLQRIAGQQPPLVRACGVIDRQVSHMARLVDDLLDVSRVARGSVQLRRERCELSRLLRQTAEDYRSTLEASGLRLELDLPPDPLWVHGDPTRLSQVLSNVLHNAGKFTDPGGRVTVALSATAEGSAVVRVRDTGIGLDPAMLARVFDPFNQAERSRERSRGGLGLGLALVKGIVALHGGTVSAESQGIGHGTEMVLHLPLELPASLTPPA
ncbi:sensor histidine kinase [Sorangium sp. So ce406]|uniref:PAS domain-containing sensor histidine kinase n=1 Tax=Sorangium sp. So ce406 TaxID=3133311 RepID=UPI003F5BE4C2